MSTQLKISANTSEVKKSLLDLGRDVKSMGKSKISVFSEVDRKFIKGELNRELGLMKAKLSENKAEIAKMVHEQTKLEKGSKSELEQRKKILSAYKTQTKLAQDMDRVQKQRKDMGGFGGAGGAGGGSGGIAGLLGKLGGMAAGGALALGGMGLVRGYQGAQQFAGGASNRVRLRGLGQESMNMGSPEDLANAGLTEQDFIKRQIATTSTLGREGGSRESIMRQAKFERSFGLEEGSMMNTSGALRANMGGKGADQAQLKIQAAVLASGIEDALSPYLDSITDVLGDINSNGLTNTTEMINMFSQMVKDGKRTPEQLAEGFKTIDSAVKGATGEANAFMQTAFARGGIGNGTVGSTRLAMSSGGVFGLSEDELLNRGYNEKLVGNMKGAGFTSGLGNRSGAILDQFKKSAGLKKGQNIGDITDVNTMTGLSHMANGVMGTQGLQGFDALQMMEQVQNKQMTQKQFEKKVQDMKDKQDPSLDRLNKINTSLEGQTEILRNINTNLSEMLGKSAVKAANIAVEGDNALIQGTSNVAGAIDQTGALDAGLTGAKSMRQNLTGGGLGDKLYDFLNGDAEKSITDAYMSRVNKKGNMPQNAGPSDQTQGGAPDMEKAIERGMTRAMKAQQAPVIQNTNKTTVKVQTPDGRISEKTHR